MKNLITNLNKTFDNRIRLGIMSVLMVNEWVTFKEMKETLLITDGNLASHIKALEKVDFVQLRKEFIGRKPQTSYTATALGRKAFNDHLDALENLLKNR